MFSFKKLFDLFLCVGLFRLYLGDGGDSNQTSETKTVNTTNVTDQRTVADAGAMVLGNGAQQSLTSNSTTNTTTNVSATDLGSINRAFDLAQQTIIAATKSATEASTKAGALASTALDMSNASTTELKGAYESSGKQILIFGAIVAGVLLIMVYGVKK